MSDIQEVVEPLEKKCPRCGKPSANKSNPSGRCSACLKKLATAKKTPGHWQRAQTKADDALRRQKGKNGTAHKKSSGLGTRASIVKQTQSAEKRTGQELSPDRKNNGKGYASSNTRMVPEKLNRGRHHVDPKKLVAWRKRLKKSKLDADQFYTLLKARALETQDQEMLELVKAIHEEFSVIESSEVANRFLDIFEEVQELKKGSFDDIKPKATTKPKVEDDPRQHYRNLHPDTHAFLQKLNSSSPVASHEIVTPEEGGFDDDDIEPGDLIINHDFGDSHDDDHMGHNDFDAFQEHMNDHNRQIRGHMTNKGFFLADHNDGSGGGLHYGATLWRRDPNFKKPKDKTPKPAPPPDPTMSV